MGWVTRIAIKKKLSQKALFVILAISLSYFHFASAENLMILVSIDTRRCFSIAKIFFQECFVAK
jgi:hypothetical protein